MSGIDINMQEKRRIVTIDPCVKTRMAYFWTAQQRVKKSLPTAMAYIFQLLVFEEPPSQACAKPIGFELNFDFDFVKIRKFRF